MNSRGPQIRRRLEAARLYVITPDERPSRVVDIAAAAQRGGADVVQLRHKSIPRGELLDLARALREVLTSALFVVDDQLDIAMLAGADGVHVGPDDLSVASARTVAGADLLIGASAWTVESARRAIADGADYIGCGPAFATPIKGEKQVVGPDGIAAVARSVDAPVFAIGGIDHSNVARLTSLGLRRVCVIRAVGGAADPEAATRRLRAMLDA